VVGCGQLRPDDRGRGEVAICAAVLGGRGAVAVREAGAGHAHQQLQRAQQRDRREGGEQLGADALGGVGDVEGDRDGGGTGDQ
jgi:hypothetical protein